MMKESEKKDNNMVHDTYYLVATLMKTTIPWGHIYGSERVREPRLFTRVIANANHASSLKEGLSEADRIVEHLNLMEGGKTGEIYEVPPFVAQMEWHFAFEIDGLRPVTEGPLLSYQIMWLDDVTRNEGVPVSSSRRRRN